MIPCWSGRAGRDRKGTRKEIRHLGPLFGLKSKGKDSEPGRYMILIMKKHGGRDANEREVAKMTQEFELNVPYGVSDDDLGVGGKRGRE